MITTPSVSVNDAFEKCAKSFGLLRTLSTIKNQQPSTVTEDFALVPRERCQQGDRRVIQAVERLLERALCSVEYTPAEATLKKLRDGVTYFIETSQEFSEEAKNNDPTLDPELSYIKDFLLCTPKIPKTAAADVSKEIKKQQSSSRFSLESRLSEKIYWFHLKLRNFVEAMSFGFAAVEAAHSVPTGDAVASKG